MPYQRLPGVPAAAGWPGNAINVSAIMSNTEAVTSLLQATSGATAVIGATCGMSSRTATHVTVLGTVSVFLPHANFLSYHVVRSMQSRPSSSHLF